MLLLLVFLKGFRLAATTTLDGAMYLHHPIFLWVQRVTPKRASVIGAPPGRTQAPLPPIGQISVLEKSRLALNLPHTRFVSYCRKHSADVHPHACRGHPPDPYAACGRNFLESVPKGQPKNGHFRQHCRKSTLPEEGLTTVSTPPHVQWMHHFFC